MLVDIGVPAGSVGWLDRLDRFVTSEALDLYSLYRPGDGGRTDAVIVATIDTAVRQAASGHLADVLGKVTAVVTVPATLGESELAPASDRPPNATGDSRPPCGMPGRTTTCRT